MKNKFILAACFAAMAMTACSTKSTQEAEAANAVEEQSATQSVVAMAPTATDGKVIELNDPAAYAPGVNVSQLTVLDFNAVWCGPCRQLAPVVEEMAKKYAGKATFVSIDIDKYGELFEAYNLGSSIPAVVFLAPGQEPKSFIGTGDLLPADKFEAIINQYVK